MSMDELRKLSGLPITEAFVEPKKVAAELKNAIKKMGVKATIKSDPKTIKIKLTGATKDQVKEIRALVDKADRWENVVINHDTPMTEDELTEASDKLAKAEWDEIHQAYLVMDDFVSHTFGSKKLTVIFKKHKLDGELKRVRKLAEKLADELDGLQDDIERANQKQTGKPMEH